MKIHITDHALEELQSAYDWLAEYSKFAAEQWKSRFTTALAKLEHLAESCPLAPEAESLNIQLRQYIIGKRRGRYRVLFVILADEVHILRIRHGSMDFLNKMNQDEN